MGKVRDVRFDTYKGVLIALVVVGHYLWGYRDVSWVGGVEKLIYLFHMPAFILVSGYFSHEKSTAKSIVKLLVSYVLINSFMMWFCYFFKHVSLDLVTPYYSCWYLLALILWRLTLPFVLKIGKSRALVMSLVLCLGLSVGMTDEITNEFALARTIAFYPFFLLGFLLKDGKAPTFQVEHGAAKVIQPLCACVVFALLLFASNWAISYFGITLNDEMMVHYKGDLAAELFNRVFVYAMGFLLSIALFFCMPSCKVPLLSSWGKNSLTIYLFHRVFPLTVLLVIPWATLEVPSVATWLFPLLLLLSFLTLLVFGWEKVAKLYSKLVDAIMEALYDENTGSARHGVVTVGGILLLCFAMFLSQHPF